MREMRSKFRRITIANHDVPLGEQDSLFRIVLNNIPPPPVPPPSVPEQQVPPPPSVPEQQVPPPPSVPEQQVPPPSVPEQQVPPPPSVPEQQVPISLVDRTVQRLRTFTSRFNSRTVIQYAMHYLQSNNVELPNRVYDTLRLGDTNRLITILSELFVENSLDPSNIVIPPRDPPTPQQSVLDIIQQLRNTGVPLQGLIGVLVVRIESRGVPVPGNIWMNGSNLTEDQRLTHLVELIVQHNIPFPRYLNIPPPRPVSQRPPSRPVSQRPPSRPTPPPSGPSVMNIVTCCSDETIECGVCLEEFKGDRCIKLPCSHTFCSLCVIRVKNRKCPFCRKAF